MKNTFNILFLITISFIWVVACQPNVSEEGETPTETQQDEVSETETPKTKNSFSVYDLTNFIGEFTDAEGTKTMWQPDLASARVYYTPKNDIERIEITASRVEDISTIKVGIFMFKGVGTYELKNDEATGKGIGMAEFIITEDGKQKDFFSTQGSQVTITSFDETNGVISGTIDLLSFFYKGQGMMPDTRDFKGTFSGKRIEQ